MKKIINGKKYDTTTATRIACDTNFRGSITETDYYTSDLFKKKTGEYFVYDFGNKWSKQAGEKITPLTEQEAKQWCEEHLDGDEYEAIWGEVEE